MQNTAALSPIGVEAIRPRLKNAPKFATRTSVLVCVALGVIAGSASIRAQPPAAPVQYIDHIMVRTDEPQALFAFFTETLELPIAWPLEDRNGVVSGGVGFGNVNIEAIEFPGQISEPAATHLVGLALEPGSLERSLAELRRRGIAYGAPRPFVTIAPDGSRATSFTNVTLQSFSDADLPGQATIQVFLSEYNPTYVDAVARRRRLRDELVAKRGGPLGVVRVREVVIGTADTRAANSDWERLLAPARPSSEGVWPIGDGPAVRLVRGERTSIEGVVLSVASLPAARRFLQERDLLGSGSDTELTIFAPAIRGLDIRLVSE